MKIVCKSNACRYDEPRQMTQRELRYINLIATAMSKINLSHKLDNRADQIIG
jgi:hypothetical protein